MQKKERLSIIDILVLLATVLVVLGHHKFLSEETVWYTVFGKIIYSFHMGFFMTLSGFLIRYTFPNDCRWREYVGRKIRKFVPAYFAVGLLAAILSYKSFEGLISALILLVVDPVHGPIQIIWYIYVLLMYYSLAPFVYKLSTKWRWCLFALSLIPSALYYIFPSYCNLSHFFRLLPFFLLGSNLADYYKKIQSIKDWVVFIFGIPFLVFLILCVWSNSNPLESPEGLGKLTSSLMSLPFLYYVARKLARISKITKLSIGFSPFVYSVYLWQMFFINGIRTMWQAMPWHLNNASAVVYLVCSTMGTIIGIVLMIKVWHLVKKKILD